MNRILKIILIATGFVSLKAQGQNLITNGSFESGFSGWNNLVGGGGAATYSLSTTDKYDGTQAMQVVVTTLGTNGYDIQSLGPNWTATIGQTYTITLYAKSLTAGAQVNIVQQNTSYSSNTLTLTTSWAQYQYSYVASEVSPQFKIQFPQKGTFLIDGISVIPYVPANTNTLTISPATVYQTVEGFGGAMYYYNSWIADNPNSDSIYRLLYQDLSLDWLRLNNGFSYQNPFNPTTDLKNIVGARKYNPSVKLMMSAWSPPANLKNNNSTTNGGTLKKHWLGTDSGFVYNQYGKWWGDAVVAYNALGVNLTYISLQNEPDITTGYQSCRFNGTEGLSGGYAGIDKAIDSVYNNIKGLSYAPKILGSESFEAGASAFKSFNAGLKSKSYVHGYNYHLYDQNSSTPNSFDAALTNIATNYSDKPNYMTEYTLNGWFNAAQVINKTLGLANASVFFYWDVVYPGSEVIDIDCNYKDCYPYTFKYPGVYYAVKPNYYSIKHFSKFIQPGYKHIGGVGTNSSIQSSAYIDPTGSTIVAVLINTEAIAVTTSINLTGYKIVGSQVYQSTTGSYFVNKGALPSGNSISLPDTSVTTIVMQVQPTTCSATITPASSTTLCQGGNVVLKANSGASYVWYNGTTQVGTSATYTATTAGSYTVKVTDGTGCSATSLATTVTVNANPTATITSSATSFCAGGSLSLTSSAGTTYLWKNGTTTVGTSQTYTAAAAGSYTVIISNASGCKDTSVAKVITVNANPTATITSSATSFCAGGSLPLTSSAGTTYLWRNGTTTVGTAQTYTATTAGSYTVIISNASGCKDTSVAKVITVNANPTATITSSATSFCAGGSLPLTSSAGTTYLWRNGTITVGTAQTYTATAAGSYTVIISNASGCKDTSVAKVITVNANPTATITSSATSFCAGGSLPLTSSAGTTYLWRNGTTTVGTAQTYTATTAGSYTVIISNASGCKDTSSATIVTVNPLPSIVKYININSKGWQTLSSATVCDSSSVYFGPQPNVTTGWTWTGPNGFTSVLRNPLINPTTPKQAGTYTATYTDPNGCKDTANFTLSVSVPTASITASATSFCPGSNVMLTANQGTAYQWFNGTAKVGTASTFTATSAGNYTVAVTNSNGCTATSSSTVITVNTPPTVAITSPLNNATISANNVILTATATGGTISNVSFYENGTLIGSDATSPYSYSASNLANGSYVFSAVAKNSNNCADTAKVNVTINKIVTGLESQTTMEETVLCYPNPYSSAFTIVAKGDFFYSVCDMAGNEVEKGSGQEIATAGQSLPVGMYLLKIYGSQAGNKVLKVTKGN